MASSWRLIPTSPRRRRTEALRGPTRRRDAIVLFDTRCCRCRRRLWRSGPYVDPLDSPLPRLRPLGSLVAQLRLFKKVFHSSLRIRLAMGRCAGSLYVEERERNTRETSNCMRRGGEGAGTELGGVCRLISPSFSFSPEGGIAKSAHLSRASLFQLPVGKPAIFANASKWSKFKAGCAPRTYEKK